ncbi:MAG: type II secretion system F family protein [Gemmataceae bacterium]|nr:type II secretion system F family protein [Gemmata sp.]MDW8197950.1 type II secretion system F family protein [Gemmataceae bacterium]
MLLTSSRCPLPALVAWCQALHWSTNAGLDLAKTFRQQAKSGPRVLRAVANEIAAALSRGSSLTEAFEPHRNRFPPLFLELVAVGEQTGRLDETFHQLAEYYQTVLTVQRNFRAQMVYPAIQFFAAILIISGLIFVLGMLGSQLDPLGWGLTGTRGALVFLAVALGLVAIVMMIVKIAAERVSLRAKMEGSLLWVPGWGPALQAFAVMRFAVALRMCTEAGLRLEKALRYSFRATANSAFMAGEQRAVAVIKRGRELSEAIRASGAPFPEDFYEILRVGEETGNIAEVMERLADHLREQAQRKLKIAAQFTSYAIYALVALMIIVFIFRIAGAVFGAYAGGA